jgi:hypothetical protein
MSKTFSVSVRLQRVTIESAFVSVPLIHDLFDQTGTLNAEKLMQSALELGRHPETAWTLEGDAEISAHPIQIAPD